MGKSHEPAMVLRLDDAEGQSTFLAFPHEAVRTLADKLAASLWQRGEVRSGSEYGSFQVSPPISDEPVDVTALRVTVVRFYESEDGSGVRFEFEHPDGDVTPAFFPLGLVHMLADRLLAKAEEQ